jgi:hypothetical protein
MSKNTKNTNKKIRDDSEPSALQRTNLSKGPFHLVLPDIDEEATQVATSTSSSSSNIIRKYLARNISLSKKLTTNTPSSSTPSSSTTPSALANIQMKIPNIRLLKSCIDLPKKIPQPLENEDERGKF